MSDQGKLRRRRVLLEIETALAPGRDMLRGIAKFVREVHRWDVHHDAGHWSLHGGISGPSRIEQLPAEREIDGVITRIYDEASERAAVESIGRGIPVVDILGDCEGRSVPLVHCDDAAIARMALDHLREQGFRRFAFYGIEGAAWSVRRGQTFHEQVSQLGLDPPMFALPKFSDRGGESDVLGVEAWLERLPKPVAIFVSCDHIAPLLLEGCARLGFTVPEQVALVGVNDDSVVCNVCTPTLSSIDASHFEIGYRAARLLEDLMDGGDPPGTPIFIPPSRLVVRGSSGEAVIDDPMIAHAARFIIRNAGSPIGVDDVVASVPLSRRELQRRFRQVTGKTIHSSLLDARMEIAKRLLVAGEYTVEAVAEMSGFGSRQHFTKTFNSQTGTTPAKYRRNFGVR